MTPVWFKILATSGVVAFGVAAILLALRYSKARPKK